MSDSQSVRLIQGDLFETKRGILVIPRSTTGTVSESFERGLTRLGYMHQLQPSVLGSVEYGGEIISGLHLIYATSVNNNSSDYSSISEIGVGLHNLLHGNELSGDVYCPLLGTGAGQLSPFLCLTYLAVPFLKAPFRYPFNIVVFDQILFGNLINLFIADHTVLARVALQQVYADLRRYDVIKSILEDKNFYFQYASDSLSAVLAYPLSPNARQNLLTAHEKFEGSFQEFIDTQASSRTKDYLTLIGQLIAYLDTKGYNKQVWNRYADKRTVANANVRQNVWVRHIMGYAIHRDLTLLPNNVRNAILYLEKPIETPVLSAADRENIVWTFLNREVQDDTFGREMTAYISGIVDIEPVYARNWGILTSRIMYTPLIRHLWDYELNVRKSPSLYQQQSNEAIASDLSQAKGVILEEGATPFTFRNDQVKAVLDVDLQAQIFFRLIQSIPVDENGLLLGVFGRWGRGKTYFWKQLSKYFSKDNGFSAIEFHAWKYQDTPASWAYIYEVFAEAFFKQPAPFFWRWKIKWRPYARVLNRLKLNMTRYGQFGFWSALVALSAGVYWCFFVGFEYKFNLVSNILSIIGISGVAGLITYYYSYSGTAKSLFRKYFSDVGFKNLLGVQAEIQKEFISLICAWIPSTKVGTQRIVLFVDDIDRCSEERIIQVIDSLKIMMDDKFISQRIVVIAAVDEGVLKRAIKQKYHDMVSRDLKLTNQQKGDELERLCREYMDKLFLNGFKLGKLTDQNKLDLLGSYADGKIFFRNDARINSYLNYDQQHDQTPGEEIVQPDHAALRENNEITPDLQDYISLLPKDNFELMDYEFERLSMAIRNLKDATPRLIRIVYYRYLLSKFFKETLIRDRSSIHQQWRSDDDRKAILPYLIVEYSALKSHVDLEMKISEISKSSEKEIVIDSMDRKFKLSKELALALLKTVETVVPY